MKRRSQSSFGLHFDFHATPAPGRVVGATLKEEDIREICRRIRPDFIQIDCKGHPGWSSYPTKYGNPMPDFACDTLKLWRRVTAEEDVALYMHYSGVMDEHYCKTHPEDAVVWANGSRSPNITRTLGPYVDKVLIPQLKELAGVYGVNGVWIDGECWATSVDFHPDTLAAFEKETGVSLNGRLPATKDDPYYQEFREFCRELFRRYVRHYTDAVHAEYPDFQIASNWSFSDHMPEPVSAGVDFLSGDFNPWNSFNIARQAGRALDQQNFPWDLMAWNFRAQDGSKPSNVPKHPVQIMQEAADIVALGGGFQVYVTQYPDGSPRMEQIRRLQPVADFVRERQAYCFRSQPVHEAAVLLSTHDRALEAGGLYDRAGFTRMAGLINLFCDAGQSVELAMEYVLRENCDAYKLIAVPELRYELEPGLLEKLLAYAENGGSLLLTGLHTCRLFAEHLPCTIDDAERSGQWRWVSCDHAEAGMLRDAHDITADGAETVVWFGDNENDTTHPGGVVLPYGKGKIALLPADIGVQYFDCLQCVHRRILQALCQPLYTPLVRIEHAVGMLEILDRRQNGALCIQLINANGSHMNSSCATEDFIPPVVDVQLSVQMDQAPDSVLLQPGSRPLPYSYHDGRAYIDLPRVDLLDIVEIR